MNPQLHAWLQAQQDRLDQLIYQAANRYYRTQRDYYEFRNLDYDIEVTTQESFQLSAGRDLCYDRPTIGYTYSLWYHARRVNTFLMYFLRELSNADPAAPLDVFDLGAGTGAVQWAVGLVYAGMKACGLPTPRLHIINVDSSAFMLDYNRNFLWQQFLTAYPACQDINCSFEVNSWNTPVEGHGGAAWVVSSYLFDHAENQDFLADGFQALVRLYKPERVLMLTSNQTAKTRQLHLVAEAVRKVGYQMAPYKADVPLFRGALPLVTTLRRALREQRHLNVPAKEVTWDDHSFAALALARTQSAMAFSADSPAAIREWNLYLAPIVVRRDIQLNDQQRKAAEHANRPAIISGPAGCGKSVVITERIRNLVEERQYDPTLQILLCSFNKALIATLTNWLSELLDNSKCVPTLDGFRFKGSALRNISCLWFDVLPTRLGGLKGHLELSNWHTSTMTRIVEQVRLKHQLPTDKHADILHPDFLLEEFHRVYYGLSYDTDNQYATQPRPGRGKSPKLDAGKTRRQLVAECFALYVPELVKTDSFTSRRLAFLRQLRRGNHPLKYDYLFVDEFQDCTPADFEIFQHLLHNPEHLVLAGDLAQSVQIGRSSAAKIPRLEGMVQRRIPYRLQGSYRLPFRISEAIRGISEHINTLYEGDSSAGVISPYKGSPPGARPILVYAEDSAQLADKLAEVIRTYACFNLREVAILEKDTLLKTTLENRLPPGIPVDTDTILKLKGLEKTCVVWSTSAGIEHRGELFEFIYTILTRTSCLLIIALQPHTLPIYLPVLRQLHTERLICWDEESRQQFRKIQAMDISEQLEVEELEAE
ncbi:UvrD-helicase domain-containing protein [Hymenobacter sp. CRA2]|uniref:UvrD-helicase domain-containing protein n=1 Tax=Hymenobacter sp. CRA2 TaxID=1955620 RepID=UPI00098FFFE3|nr:UvrD-helicase domain-containing protein [Hymenobacter sp. CRA2]OON65261.1 hypothetical protein B0919_24495 [Hymenobacter sp. CRA2]